MTPEALQTAMVGARLIAAEPLDFTWFFRFDNGCVVGTESFWRVLAGGRLAVSQEDHECLFGLPKPVNAGKSAMALLTGSVSDVRVSTVGCDLMITFGTDAVLELLNTSSGYESWHMLLSNGVELIALGGGGVNERAAPSRQP